MTRIIKVSGERFYEAKKKKASVMMDFGVNTELELEMPEKGLLVAFEVIFASAKADSNV